MLVKSSSRIGTVKGDGGGVQVRVIEYLDTGSGEKTRGIEFLITAKNGSYPQTDYDEIEPLLKGIDRLVTLDKGITELDGAGNGGNAYGFVVASGSAVPDLGR